ncbi:MAG: acylase [Acidobacteriota bacterium]|nr:acylase [Acidobacteriota bacterium]
MRYLFLFACVVICWQCGPNTPDTSNETRILWDGYGVPHIFAPDLTAAFYAQGWAQARNHGDLILKLFGEARGRGAEYWGEDHLDIDKWMHINDVPNRAEAWYGRLGQEERGWVDAFAKGINDYAARHPDLIADDKKVVLPVTGSDISAHLQRVLHFSFVVRPGKIDRDLSTMGGSNAWAVSPARSASGKAMLLANPHLPWNDYFLFFESHMMTPDMNMYGVTLVGSPGITIGFNQHLGWTHTVNTHDGFDLYELETVEGGYRWNGEVKAFETREVTLKINNEQGGYDQEILTVESSVHGPVVREIDGKKLALRTVGLDKPHLLDQYVQMGRARNLEEFEKALARLQMPMFTVMYADKEGHIMHLFGGEIPKRSQKDWAYWQEPVPGTSEDNLWTEIHPYGDLPRVVDPPSGRLQNANDPPWTTTFPTAIDPNDYPGYMAPRFMHFRAQSSARLLAEDDKISFEELIAYKHDSRMVAAERILDDLERAVEQHGNARAREAMGVLEVWDGKALADSRGAVLFSAFFNKLKGDYAEPWSEEKARTTPDGLADPKAAAKLLAEVADDVEEKHGSLDIRWGDVNRFRVGDVDLPANGGPGSLGLFRVMIFEPDKDGKNRTWMGDTFVAAVEFGEPVRAQVLMSYGNASQSHSPHQADQLALLATQKLRPALLTEEDIRAHLKEEETLSPQ